MNQLKEKFSDLSHICYGYRLIENNVETEFFTDATEPKGSSGLPILNQLRKFKLINTSIFVVRYFGGSKLGIPRLIHAYGMSAKNCILNSIIELRVKIDKFEINSNYESYGIVENIINKFEGQILEKDFQEKIILRVAIKEKFVKGFQRQFNELKTVSLSLLNKK